MATNGRRDEGAALILVVIWSAMLLALAGVVSTAVLNQVRPSDRAEKSFDAWSAAEAGVDDMRARLAVNGTYWKSVAAYYADPVANAAVAAANPALAGWAPVPGGPSSAEFTVYLDTTNASRGGRMVITSTGRSGTGETEAVRTVEAEVRKRTTNDYAYLSNSETYPYDAPGVYGLPGQLSTDNKMSQTVAEVLCGTGGAGGDHYWYQWTDWIVNGVLRPQGQVTATSATNPTITGYGPHKNSSACLFGEVKATDRWVGPIHTNDVWYFDPTIPNIDPNTDSGLSTQVFRGRVSSSCPGVTPGSTVNGTCRDDHRWISTTKLPGESNRGKDPTTFITNEIPNDAAENGKLWNPEYDSPVEMPSEAQITAIRNLAASKGCVFSGPTRIRMQTAGTAGKLVVTSPDTANGSTNSFCFGGGSYYANDPKVQPTITLDYATMVAEGFNGLIFVQDSALGVTAPSCQPKTAPAIATQSSYPWIIPTAASETITVTSGTPLGFPSATTRWTGNLGPSGVYDEWTDNPAQQCSKGHLYLQANAAGGGYTGQYSIAADADIVITDDVLERSVVTAGRTTSASGVNWGVPELSSTNQLGLVPRRWIYAYHLAQQKGGNNNGIKDQLQNLVLNFSLLAPNKCFTVQDYNSQPQMFDLRIVGSVGQDSRCRITDPSSGYNNLSIVYDTRLPLLGPPPYLAELSQEPWTPLSWSETGVRRDPLAKQGIPAVTGTQTKSTTKSFDVLAGTPTGTTLLYARVASGAGTVAVSNNLVQYTSPAGVTSSIVEFVVRKPDGTRVGQTLTIAVS